MHWPDAETAQQLHRQLSSDDPVATSRFAEAFLDPLAVWLRRNNPTIHDHLCNTAAEDAIISILKSPQQYDPKRGPLDHYLRMAGRGDLLNLLEKERRYLARHSELPTVEPADDRRNNEYADSFDGDELTDDPDSELLNQIQEIAENTFTPPERHVLQLMIDGERRTVVFAQALGIEHLSDIEQRREVKQVKDRIKKRLQRARSQQ